MKNRTPSKAALLAVIFLCFIFSAGCCVFPLIAKGNTTGMACSDGTSYDMCSRSKPKYCQDGELFDAASVCGCPAGTQISGESCVSGSDTACYDGTEIGSCSNTQKYYSYYCNSDRSLVQNFTLCPCPSGFIAANRTCVVAPTKCPEGTPVGSCSATKPFYCGVDGKLVQNSVICGCPAGKVPSESGPCTKPAYNFTFHANTEPYYSAFCDKFDPYDLSVRKAASDAIRKDAGAYNPVQLFDVYDWVKKNIIYQNVPLGGVPYPASETLQTGSGDCKNQAVLIASMIEAIGGKARVIADPACSHSYAIVYFGPANASQTSFANAVQSHYGQGASIDSFIFDNGTWIVFDPAGGNYPGQLLPACDVARSFYTIETCMDCINENPGYPYTYGGKCYSECPSGTISSNPHSCSACPAGYYSWNNKCVTCANGYVLGNDGRCYPQCGGPNKYCPSGTWCSNGRCLY